LGCVATIYAVGNLLSIPEEWYADEREFGG
jgi:hypothetical protein